jgi:hypothetical protein
MKAFKPCSPPRGVERGERAMAPPTPPIWVFGTRLMMEIINASQLPVDRGYRPTSYLYGRGRRGGEKEGVFAKGLKMKDKVVVKKMLFDGDNWEVEARVQSESSPDTTYTVLVYLPLDFECTCPWSQHHFSPCKHVYATILRLLEIAGADVKDPIVRHYVYEGLNRLAYHKARTQRRFV